MLMNRNQNLANYEKLFNLKTEKKKRQNHLTNLTFPIWILNTEINAAFFVYSEN